MRNICQTQSGQLAKFFFSLNIFKILCTLVHPLSCSLHFQLCLYWEPFIYILLKWYIKWVSVINHRCLQMAPDNRTTDLSLDILMQLGPRDLALRVGSRVQNMWLIHTCSWKTTQPWKGVNYWYMQQLG